MFHPGETVIHEFIIPFKYFTINKVIATYKQNNCFVLEKTITVFHPYYNDGDEKKEDLPCEGVRIADYDVDELFDNNAAHPIIPIVPSQSFFIVELSQQDTLFFASDQCTYVQLNVFFDNGSRVTSNEIKLEVGAQYLRQVMTV